MSAAGHKYIFLSFTNILMTNAKTNGKNVLGQFYNARVRLHVLRIRNIFSASEQLSRSKKQVSRAEQINNHTYVQWNCHFCRILDRLHMYSRSPYSIAEALEHMGCIWQDKVKWLTKWEIHHLVTIILAYIIFWRCHLMLDNRNKSPSSSSIFNLTGKLPIFRSSFRALIQNFC